MQSRRTKLSEVQLPREANRGRIARSVANQWTARRAVFLAQGFDGASMGEIARRAASRKARLYVYFDSKEACS